MDNDYFDERSTRIYNAMKSVVSRGVVSLEPVAQELRRNGFRWSTIVESDLCEVVRRWARHTPLRTFEGEMYIFNGRIYELVVMKELEFFFGDILREFGIKAPVAKVHSLFNYGYADSIKVLNRLYPKADIIAFRNGVLDTNTCLLYGFNPEFHVIEYHDFNYDPHARCKKWMRFLKEILPERVKREILQMYLGMGLIDRGKLTGERVDLALMLVGEGANGKSVIFKTMVGMFGREKIGALSYQELTMGGDEGLRNRSILQDIVFNWSSDEDSRYFGVRNTGQFKRIVSGEPVMTRKIGNNLQTSFRMPWLIFNLNEQPTPDDTTLGLIRRLQYINFDVTIPESRQNRNLPAELVEEYAGIFNWLMRGCQEVKRREFKFPTAVAGRREKLKSLLKNPVRAWKEAYGVRTTEESPGEIPMYVTAKNMHEYISRFCEDNDIDEMSTTAVGRLLGKLKFTKIRQPTGFRYKIYGVTEQMLEQPFVINDLKTDVTYKPDLKSVLLDSD